MHTKTKKQQRNTKDKGKYIKQQIINNKTHTSERTAA